VKVGRRSAIDLEHITGSSRASCSPLRKATRRRCRRSGRTWTSRQLAGAQQFSAAVDGAGHAERAAHEIGEINGFIVQKAKEAGCAAPTHARWSRSFAGVERGEVSPRPELLFRGLNRIMSQ